jgi:hypothetical protein
LLSQQGATIAVAVNGNTVTANSANLATYWAQKCCVSGSTGSAVYTSCAASTTTCADGSNPGVFVQISATLPFTPFFSSDSQLTGTSLSSSILARVK